MAVATAVSLRSKCLRDQVGAVLISTDQRVLATGYNGQPSGYPHHCESCPRSQGNTLADAYADCTSIHAEVNCLLFSDMSRRSGATLYVTRMPCWGCAKIVANSGVAKVVVPAMSDLESSSVTFLRDSGVAVHTF